MHKHTNQFSFRLALILCTLTLVLAGLTTQTATGASITTIDGALDEEYLKVPGNVDEAWDTLLDTFRRMNIPVLASDNNHHQLTTDWLNWYVEEGSEEGVRTPKFFEKLISNRERERHRFAFQIIPDADPKSSRIKVKNTQRQIEVDRTPDSTYSWLDWDDSPTQAVAARALIKHIQGAYESAIATQLVSSGVVTGSSADEQGIGSVSRANIPEPIREPSPIYTPGKPVSSPIREPSPEYVPNQPLPEPARAPAAVSDLSNAEEASAGSAQSTAETPPEKNTTVAHIDDQSRTATRPAKPEASFRGNVLWIQADAGKAWRAVRRALADMDIIPEIEDEQQGVISTAWIRAIYDSGNKTLLQESNYDDGPRWGFKFFSIDEKGLQKHRFQVVLIPAKDDKGTLVYAYHIGFQEQIDETPDAEVTMLAWQKRETQNEIAGAFLRDLSTHVRIK